MYVALVTYSKCIGCSGYLQQVYLLRMLGKPQGDGGNKDIQCTHLLRVYTHSLGKPKDAFRAFCIPT